METVHINIFVHVCREACYELAKELMHTLPKSQHHLLPGASNNWFSSSLVNPTLSLSHPLTLINPKLLFISMMTWCHLLLHIITVA